jgi:predicted GNAT superfamily acetyltransferase
VLPKKHRRDCTIAVALQMRVKCAQRERQALTALKRQAWTWGPQRSLFQCRP